MEAIDRFNKAIEMGYKYDEISGNITGVRNFVIKCKSNKGYIHFPINVSGKKYFISGHRFGFYCKYGFIPKEIDHINGIRDDNRIENLRSVTKNQNMWNQKNAKGYTYHKKSDKYQAQIAINNKLIYLGLYQNEIDARNAYMNAKKQLHKI